jgi:hypothetical protein
MRLISALLLISSALLAQGAAAQIRIFCCDDATGKKVCGDFLPPACQGRAYEERDNRGFVSKKVEAPLTAEQQARRDAELAKKEEEKKKSAEDRRRSVALLATYFFFSSSLTCCGLALPLLAFMTWPTRALKAFSLPARNSSTDFGLAASTSSMIFSMAPVSVICFRPWPR